MRKPSVADADVRVSILTGPGGPVLRLTRPSRARRTACFNPHRARRPGATSVVSTAPAASMMFQSSPGPEARCYLRLCG